MVLLSLAKQSSSALAITNGVRAAVDNNAAQHRRDRDPDEGGVKENRTSRLQIDSAVFQFPHSAMARPVKLSPEIQNEGKENTSTLTF